MDFDDFEDLGESKKVPSRTSKFEPKNLKNKPQPRGKIQSKPGLQNLTSKSEAQESALAAEREPQNDHVLRINRDEEESKPKIDDMLKIEPLVLNNGPCKMEVDAKTEIEAVRKLSDPMEEDEKEEEEDMIVREIDVYFNPCIDPESELYVMQYPLRPRWRPYELDERCQEVRVKPRTKEVQIDLSIDDSANWDHAKARKLNMTKQTLTTSFMPSSSSGYAVGVLIGNKLHLNPVDAIVQLRPSLEHMDPIDSKRKNNAASKTGAAVRLEDPNDRKAGSSMKQIKNPELENDQISEAEECWIPLKYHGPKSELSSAYLQKMMVQESSELEFTMSPYDYVNSFCPVPSNDSTKSKYPSKRHLLSLELEERVKTLLLEGPPIKRFSVFKHFAPDATPEDLLAVLNKNGRLVQGLWAADSVLVFPDKKEVFKIVARDYILFCFSQSLTIQSSQLNVPIMLKEDVRSFLNIFAVERPCFKDWKFKENPDSGFIKCYQDILRKQEESWRKVEGKLKKYFEGRASTVPKQSVPRNPVKPLNPEKSMPNATSGSRVLAKTTITVETREALLKALPKVIQNHKVCSFELICQGLRDLAISQSALPKSDPKLLKAAASGADAPPEELKEIIGQVAFNIHGSYVLKSSPDHPQYDELRRVVVDLLFARGSDAKLKKAEVFEAANLALKRDITQTEYIKVMTDFCESKGSAWVLKSGDGKPS